MEQYIYKHQARLLSYKDLIVWQKAVELVEAVYKLTSQFPNEEKFAIVSQLRRAAVSVPSNIAEGYGRRSKKEYLQFFSIAYGSSLELETQLIISKKLKFASEQAFKEAETPLEEVKKMLYTMIFKRKEF